MINVAVIGNGGICPAHISAYLQFPERCRIVALVDIVPGKAAKMRDRFSLECKTLEDYHDLFSMGIDLADICTPPFTHAMIAIDCLRAGINTVCEKPMAASLAECDEMIKARDESGKKLTIIAQNRFRKEIRDVRELVQSGIAGRVRDARIDSFWFRAHCYYDLWWRGTWEKEGGGCTLNHAVHHIDMLGWIMGLPQRVTSILANTGHDNAEVEDLSVSVMEYPGALATVTASVVHHGEEQKLVFQCEKAKVSAPFDCFASITHPNGFPEKEPDAAFRAKAEAFLKELPPIPYENHTGQLEAMLTALETNGPVPISGEEGRRTIEIITAIYEAGSLRRGVDLPLKRDDPFYTVDGIRAHVPHFYEKSASVADFEGDIVVGGSRKDG